MSPGVIAAIADRRELPGFYADAPHGVRVNMVFSADGAAAFAGRAGPLSCAADQELFTALRGFADVILVGAATARAEGYGPVRLTAEQNDLRRAAGYPADPPPIAVVSRSGRLPQSLYDDPGQPPILVTTAKTAAVVAADEKCGRLLVAGEDGVDVGEAVARLRADGMHRILCEGGPTLLEQLVDADAVDEVCVTVAPRLAGSQPVGHAPASGRESPAHLRLHHTLVHDDYLFLRYTRP